MCYVEQTSLMYSHLQNNREGTQALIGKKAHR